MFHMFVVVLEVSQCVPYVCCCARDVTICSMCLLLC